DLEADLSETNNLATTMPEKVGELYQLYVDWKKEVGAQEPELKANIQNGNYYLKAVHSDMVMAVKNGSTIQSESVVQENLTQQSHQQWKFYNLGTGYFNLENVNSGYLMEVKGWGTTPGTDVTVWGTHSKHKEHTSRQWKFSKQPEGYYWIQSKQSGLYLNIQGGSMLQGGNLETNILDSNAKNNAFWLYHKDSLPTSITDYHEHKFASIYPNPTGNDLLISFNEKCSGQILLMNMSGKELIKMDFSNSTLAKLNISHLATGMYIVNIRTLNSVISKRIILK
ncbi:MAG: RICIN domain-containing protein, partial [Bacteroidales bacterium]|nr:RICIN domain-containing protein [Bacteroidales bacterium]